jgi:hypothetical protein
MEANAKHHKNDAHFGKLANIATVTDKTRGKRPNRHTRQQIANQ